MRKNELLMAAFAGMLAVSPVGCGSHTQAAGGGSGMPVQAIGEAMEPLAAVTKEVDAGEMMTAQRSLMPEMMPEPAGTPETQPDQTAEEKTAEDGPSQGIAAAPVPAQEIPQKQEELQEPENSQPEEPPIQEPAPEEPAAANPPAPEPAEPEPPAPEPEEPEPPKPKSIYDYEFDIEAIRQELIALGERMGLCHITTDDGRTVTPENASWATPVTASESFQGANLERKLKDYVQSMPGIITAYGGNEITRFTIYAEPLGGGSYRIYFLY